MKIDGMTKKIADLVSRLGEEFGGTTEELEREMRNFKNIDLDKRAKLAEVLFKFRFKLVMLCYYLFILNRISNAGMIGSPNISQL